MLQVLISDPGNKIFYLKFKENIIEAVNYTLS